MLCEYIKPNCCQKGKLRRGVGAHLENILKNSLIYKFGNAQNGVGYENNDFLYSNYITLVKIFYSR